VGCVVTEKRLARQSQGGPRAVSIAEGARRGWSAGPHSGSLPMSPWMLVTPFIMECCMFEIHKIDKITWIFFGNVMTHAGDKNLLSMCAVVRCHVQIYLLYTDSSICWMSLYTKNLNYRMDLRKNATLENLALHVCAVRSILSTQLPSMYSIIVKPELHARARQKLLISRFENVKSTNAAV
jgi:hypothetical protein